MFCLGHSDFRLSIQTFSDVMCSDIVFFIFHSDSFGTDFFGSASKAIAAINKRDFSEGLLQLGTHHSERR